MSDAEPLYYAKEDMVWRRPISKKRADGTTNIMIGFPVCKMHDAVGTPAAYAVARLMNLGHTAASSASSRANGLDRDQRLCRNFLCILDSLDMRELVEAAIIIASDWPAFRDDPRRAYLRLGDEREAKCFALIQARLPGELRAEGGAS